MKDALIIEDERYANELTGILERDGFVVEETTAFDDAISRLRCGRFSVIVADIHQVGESEHFWQVRHDYARRVPVVLSCDRLSLNEALFPIRQYVHDIILKPYDKDEASTLIRQMRGLYLEKEQIKEVLPRMEASTAASVPAHTNYVGPFAAYIRKFATLHGFEQDSLDIRVAFEEAFLNAIHHGSSNDDSKTVHISVSANDAALTIRIEDEGPGFDHASHIAKADLSNSNIFAGGGRGLFLIARHLDEFRYENGGRVIVLIKNKR